MKYLLDTSVLIDFFRNKLEAVELISKLVEESFAISVITFAEYLLGAYKTANYKANIDLFEKFISQNQIQVINIDQEIADVYAAESANLEKSGSKLSGFDMLIAATAISHKLTLVSGDKAFKRLKDLQLIGLNI